MNLPPYIVTIGSGNGENILVSDTPIETGHKHPVTVKEMYGGSGVNHSFRLASMGKNIFPVLSIGNDGIGRKIQKELAKVARHNIISPQALNYIESDGFFDEEISTPTSTVILDGVIRTIFSQKVSCSEHSATNINNRLDKIENLTGSSPDAVMIGHIHSDGGTCDESDKGRVTKSVVDRYKGNSLIYSNFGNSQIQHGLGFWDRDLADIDVFQLNLAESRKFFSDDSKGDTSLSRLLDIIREKHINAVITIDRFGAIGLHKDKPDDVVFAWSLISVGDIVDTTGAGDAFAAGMVSYLVDAQKDDFDTFQSAMETARDWSAYACTKLGGSADCPGQIELNKFVERYSSNSKSVVESVDREEANKYLKLIDTDYQQ